MALTKNQARWAEIYIECEDDRKKIIDGKDPLEILEERSEEIRRLSSSESDNIETGESFELIREETKKNKKLNKVLEGNNRTNLGAVFYIQQN